VQIVPFWAPWRGLADRAPKGLDRARRKDGCFRRCRCVRWFEVQSLAAKKRIPAGRARVVSEEIGRGYPHTPTIAEGTAAPLLPAPIPPS